MEVDGEQYAMKSSNLEADRAGEQAVLEGRVTLPGHLLDTSWTPPSRRCSRDWWGVPT